MKKTMIRVSALILAVIIMLCPLSVCFAAEGEIVGLVGSEVINILWNTLKGWGIEILESGFEEITENVHQWLTGQLYEYLRDELNETFDYWITGMQFFRDQFGRLIGNDEYVKAADDFADHLRLAFGLTNNSTIYLEATHSIGDLPIYDFPIYCFAHDSNTASRTGEAIVQISSNSQGITVYAVPYRSNIYSDALMVLGTNSTASISYRADVIGGSALLTGSGKLASSISGTDWKFLLTFNSAPWNSENKYVLFDGAQLTLQEVKDILAVNTVVDNEGIYADNGVINLPSNDPDYEDGYSIIYYPDGTIGYLDINWPDTITVDNLPAIVSTGNIRNPGIDSVFLPIKAFINTFSDGIGLMTQLVYNMPSEIVGMALAIMSGIIVFGVIRIMKEH